MTPEQLTVVNDAAIAIVTTAGTLFAVWLNSKLDGRKSGRAAVHSSIDEMTTQLKESNEIHVHLSQLLEELDCDRILVYQFHNGERFIGTNDSFKRVSATYEVCAPGVSSEVNTLQSLPVSLSSTLVKHLQDHEYVFAQDVAQEHVLRSTLGLITARGVCSMYNVAVSDISGNMIAYVSLEWVHDERAFSDQVLRRVKEFGAKISGYLHTKYRAK